MTNNNDSVICCLAHVSSSVNQQIVVLSKGKTMGNKKVEEEYLHTLYVTSLLRIAGALFLNACKRCSDTSGKI